MAYFHIDADELKRRREAEGWTRGLLARMSRVHDRTLYRMEKAGGQYRTTDVIIENITRAFENYGSQPITVGDLSKDYVPPLAGYPRCWYDQEKVRELRRGMTLMEAAEKTGIPFSTLQSLETRPKPSAEVETLLKLAKGYGVPLGYISQPLKGIDPAAYRRWIAS